MASVITYHFNSRSSDWETNPANMVDGNIDTDASSSILDQIELLNGNSCAGTDLGTITKVELRAHGWISGGAGQVHLIPVFSGGDGDSHTPDFFAEQWSSYMDITNDTNAPDWSVWTHISTLDCKAVAKPAGGTPFCSKVEIRVTYNATYTSKNSGNWDAEGETTWNEPGHPGITDDVTIQNGHTVTLDSAASCYELVINSGGVLTDATNNVGLTVGYTTDVAGTLTCGSAVMSFGSGLFLMLSTLEIKAGGVFNGGSGNHTIGSLESITATSTLNMTSGNCTIDGTDGGVKMTISAISAFAHSNGTIILTYPGHVSVDTHALHNLTQNQVGDTHLDKALHLENNLVVTSGTFETDNDGGASFNLVIDGTVVITSTLDCKASTLIDLNDNVTINGTLIATSGSLNFSGMTWINNGIFTHNNGTVIFDGVDQKINGSNSWNHFTKSVGAARNLTVDNTSTQTLNGNVTLDGSGAASRLSILSDAAGSAFNFNMAAGAVKISLDFLSVKDSDASGSAAAHKPILPTNSIDVSGNTEWFTSAPVSITTMSAKYYY